MPFKITDEIKKELNFSSLNEWVDWLKGYVTSFSESELTDDPNADPGLESQEQITERAAYLSKLNRIAELGEAVKDKYIVSMTSSTHREETVFFYSQGRLRDHTGESSVVWNKAAANVRDYIQQTYVLSAQRSGSRDYKILDGPLNLPC